MSRLWLICAAIRQLLNSKRNGFFCFLPRYGNLWTESFQFFKRPQWSIIVTYRFTLDLRLDSLGPSRSMNIIRSVMWNIPLSFSKGLGKRIVVNFQLSHAWVLVTSDRDELGFREVEHPSVTMAHAQFSNNELQPVLLHGADHYLQWITFGVKFGRKNEISCYRNEYIWLHRRPLLDGSVRSKIFSRDKFSLARITFDSRAPKQERKIRQTAPINNHTSIPSRKKITKKGLQTISEHEVFILKSFSTDY